MSRPTKQGARAANRRQAILEASLDLFAAKGMDATGMREIARTAGLTEGTLYHYFGGKQEIAAAIVETFGYSAAAVESDTPVGVPLRDQLTAIGEGFLAVLRDNPRVTAFLMREAWRYPPAPAEVREPAGLLLALVRERAHRLAALLAGAGLPDRVAGMTAAHYFNALAGYWLTETFVAGSIPTPADAHAQITDLADLVLARIESGRSNVQGEME